MPPTSASVPEDPKPSESSPDAASNGELLEKEASIIENITEPAATNPPTATVPEKSEPIATDLNPIEFDPDSKPVRSGRPRPTALAPVSVDESSVSNLEHLTVSKFRLDLRPVEGPGSRGGDPTVVRRKRGLVQSSEGLRKRVQSTLDFSRGSDDGHVVVTGREASDATPQNGENEENHDDITEAGTAAPGFVENSEAQNGDSVKQEPELHQQNDKLKQEDAVAKPAPRKKRGKKPASRTTIVREMNRVTRTYPGPLVAVHYDLYDENLFGTDTHAAAASQPLALGAEVKPAPYAADIILILAFLTKFHRIVNFDAIGPQDLEDGLALHDTSDESTVSPLMAKLFLRLVAVALNRKKPLPASGLKRAIQELRAVYLSFGLPAEWRDDTNVRITTPTACDVVLDHVDKSKPAVGPSENYEYHTPMELHNPFLVPEVEEVGLDALQPHDRLVFLRCLCIWSLSALNTLKTHLVKVVNNQDVPGEKDPVYGSRAVLKGFSNTVELKKELESKISKKSKYTGNGTPDGDSISRYIDPTSDPTKHPMALRLNEFLIADCGFHIGRFYLARIADASGGGLASVDKMKAASKDASGVRASVCSQFKLYVEDCHSMLLDALHVHGVEFDLEGNEVPPPPKCDERKYWLEVASNTTELVTFIDLVGQKLGFFGPGEIPPTSLAYKPLLHMHQYLDTIFPLLQQQEKFHPVGAELRTARRRKVDYSRKQAEDDHDEEYDDHGDDEDDEYNLE